MEAPPSPPKPWKTPHERALTLGLRGRRMPTGFETLDRATRGGPLSGRVVVLGGAPGAGKTTLLLQLARQYHAAGHAVGVYAADEDGDGLLIRWGQQEGLDRDDLERGTEAARTTLAAAVASERLLLVDVDEEDGVTIDAVGAKLAPIAAATELPGVLLVDSLQTARTLAGDTADSPRAKIDAAIASAKSVSRTHGLLVIVTSEMARGFYRGGGAPGTEALASFKESGGIEYGAALALAMTSVKGEGDLIDVEIPKNRMGERLGFRLRLDRARASMVEVGRPDDETIQEDRRVAKDDAKERRIDDIGDRLVLALARAPRPVIGQRALKSLVKGGNEERQEAIARLRNEGRITGGGATPYRAINQAAE